MGRASTTALPPEDSSVDVSGRTRTPTRTWQEVSAEPVCVVVVVMIGLMAENLKRIFVVDDSNSLAHGERNGIAVSYQYVGRCDAGSATEGDGDSAHVRRVVPKGVPNLAYQLQRKEAVRCRRRLAMQLATVKSKSASLERNPDQP